MVPPSIDYYAKMINITRYLFLLVTLLCIPGMLLHDYLPVLMIVGYTGLACLFLLALQSHFYQRMGIPARKYLMKDYLYKLAALYNEEPKKFVSKYKQAANAGRAYLAFLLSAYVAAAMGLITTVIMLNSTLSALWIGVFSSICLVWFIAKYLVIKYEPMKANYLDESLHPDLFQLIEKACMRADMPVIDKVILDSSSGLSLISIYLGSKRSPESILTIGLFPHILLSEEELETIIMHELMHIRRNVQEQSLDINKKSAYWSSVVENAENGGIVARRLLGNFGSNYIMKINLFLRALSKMDESQVDMDTIKYINKNTYAKALMKLTIISLYFEKEVDLLKLEQAPKSLYTFMLNDFHSWFNREKSSLADRILSQKTFDEDTHLRFKERMDHIGVTDLSWDIEFSNEILSDEKEFILEDMNRWWFKANESIWNDKKKNILEYTEKSKEYIDNEEYQGSLEYGYFLEGLGRFDEALNCYESVLDREEDDAMALFRSGIIYSVRNDMKCIEFFKKAMEEDRNTISYGLSQIEDFLYRNGLLEMKKELAPCMEEMAEIYLEKEYEESHLRENDVLIQSRLTIEQKEKLASLLKEIPAVSKVMLAEKELKFSRENLIIVGIWFERDFTRILKMDSRRLDWNGIHEALSQIEGKYAAYDLRKNPTVTSRLSTVEDALLYDRIADQAE